MSPLKLKQSLDERAIYLDLDAADKDRLLEKIADLVARLHAAAPADEILEKLRDREKVMSTGIGNGVAVPHVSLASLDSSRIFLFVLKDDVDFQAIDGLPVRVIFLLVVRPDDIAFHLQGLASIARLARSPGLAEGLCVARTPAQILETIEERETTSATPR